MFIFGTRPEAVKLAPLIAAPELDSIVCSTGQHREMLAQVLEFFQIKPHYELKIMRKNQTLSALTARVLLKLSQIILPTQPDYIVVQGDTTSALAGALVGYYHKIPVLHVEAGLRSGDRYAPYPEELNRRLISQLADGHFAPTRTAAKNLKKEGLAKNVFVVGNTGIDALLWGLQKIKQNPRVYAKYFSFLAEDKKIILVTGHRRENFGKKFEQICLALRDIVRQNKDVQIVYPVHLNPQVQKPVRQILQGEPDIHLLKPLAYPRLLWLLAKCQLVLTDSGGLQEEAPALGKPALVLREVTERPEGVRVGGAKLVGTSRKDIAREARLLLVDKRAYDKMAKPRKPYGDGKASRRIVNILRGAFLGVRLA
ncbi:UDP-N-acetylglucosamine 2-epimerase [Candidatus Termititenax persephonae]|uniref:UDP-N-acetylglucosamine 2-epimerase (non-hydrolyzing) n=1 Tax=Candidatus Termititenax persephonae TaxID=2218525 RepID=A0A388THL6_9BACT|nr:UDP-N-acetylglucosamine 2-epimerase [Candidatus Termititenax persephonae]